MSSALCFQLVLLLVVLMSALAVVYVTNSHRITLHELQQEEQREQAAELQWGQLLLATAGSTSPFIGLLGTVWGIFNALTGMAEAGQITIDKVAGPVGEALVMTAAGLAVAIPAVLAYNVMGRQIGRIEAQLEGFALDLRALLSGEV